MKTLLTISLLTACLTCAVAQTTPSGAAASPGVSELIAERMEMVSTDEEARAICEGNVVFTSTNLRITCDRLEVIASRVGEGDAAIPAVERFKYLLATGEVRIVQGDREAMCGRAEVFPREQRLLLTEEPVLLDRSSDTVATADKLILMRGERRLLGENVRLTGPAIKDLGPDAQDPEPTAETPPAP